MRIRPLYDRIVVSRIAELEKTKRHHHPILPKRSLYKASPAVATVAFSRRQRPQLDIKSAT